VGELEQLYSTRSAADYDELRVDLQASFRIVGASPDIFFDELRRGSAISLITTACGTGRRSRTS
jgi:hypothetical protein